MIATIKGQVLGIEQIEAKVIDGRTIEAHKKVSLLVTHGGKYEVVVIGTKDGAALKVNTPAEMVVDIGVFQGRQYVKAL